MALVTFNEHVNGHVKGDVVDLDKAELKAIDAYAELNKIEKPYTKGAQEVANTSDALNSIDQARNDSLRSSEKSTEDDAEDASDEESTDSEPEDETETDATDEAQELPEDNGNPASDGDGENEPVETKADELPEADSEPATDEGKTPKVVKK